LVGRGYWYPYTYYFQEALLLYLYHYPNEEVKRKLYGEGTEKIDLYVMLVEIPQGNAILATKGVNNMAVFLRLQIIQISLYSLVMQVRHIGIKMAICPDNTFFFTLRGGQYWTLKRGHFSMLIDSDS
jgi:hypothetical protein